MTSYTSWRNTTELARQERAALAAPLRDVRGQAAQEVQPDEHLRAHGRWWPSLLGGQR